MIQDNFVLKSQCIFFLGVFIARGKEDALVTKNLVPGEAVYGEKRISIDVRKSVDLSSYCFVAHWIWLSCGVS